MGRLNRWAGALAAAAILGFIGADRAQAFDGFGASTADSTFGSEIRFEVELDGTPPDRLELLRSTPESEASFVTPVEPDGGSATLVWDTGIEFVRPNTVVTYQWRATTGDEVTLSPAQTIRYDDDRPEFDWQQAQLGEATVHWYGGAEAQARRFGELTAGGVERAEELLGTQLAGPVDVFAYANADDFFEALGPGTREWTGAAAIPALRTIYMRLDAGADELDRTIVHEVTHIVFFDATANPYHRPARWVNEGVATWSEIGDAGGQRSLVEFEAGNGLFSFDAITQQFPIGQRAAQLSYAQGTTMIDLIVDRYGTGAMARLTAAYRDGASDAEALESASGIAVDELYATYFDAFGVEAPEPISAEPIAPSSVERPPAGAVDAGGVDGGVNEVPPGGPDAPAPDAAPVPSAAIPVPLLLAVAGAGIAIAAVAILISRRAARRAP